MFDLTMGEYYRPYNSSGTVYLSEAKSIVNNTAYKQTKATRQTSDKMCNKCHTVFEKGSRFKTIRQFSKASEFEIVEGIKKELITKDLAFF